MITYTRTQLAQLCGISSSKLRRILKALQIKPHHTGLNSRGLPIFYYQQNVPQEIQKYLQMLQQKLQKKTGRCCVCKQEVPVSAMVGNRCVDCYVQKNCKSIIYGRNWWDRVAQTSLIDKAIQYLKKFKPDPK